ncbi:MAG TPA: histone deacetylase [bacterium]|nr:histone deacetylase [bacterium]
MPSKVGLVYSDEYLKHDTGNHSESSKRLEAILSLLKEKNVLKYLTFIKPRKADLREIEYIHSPSYIQEVREICQGGGGFLDSDTPVSSESFEVALLAAGGVFSAIDRVVGNLDSAFCLIRPPGHHALKSQGMGFCLFNNVALGARYAQNKHHLKKVLILDWDVHHGNGTQEAFWHDPSVLYFSIHQYPHYPGTGDIKEIGEGEGRGYTVNVPLPPECGDGDYIHILKELLSPIAKEFKADITFISAGFDAHRDDPLGGMGLTSQGYGALTSLVKESSKKIVSCLEGGYNLKSLGESVLTHLDSLASRPEGSRGPRGREFNLFPKERINEEPIKDVSPVRSKSLMATASDKYRRTSNGVKEIVKEVKEIHSWSFK